MGITINQLLLFGMCTTILGILVVIVQEYVRGTIFMGEETSRIDRLEKRQEGMSLAFKDYQDRVCILEKKMGFKNESANNGHPKRNRKKQSGESGRKHRSRNKKTARR